MENLKKIIQQYTDLIALIQFTERVSSKIYGLEDDEAIFKTVISEFSALKHYDCSIMLLSNDVSKLILYGASVSSDIIKLAEKKAKIRSKSFEISLEKSATYRMVVKEGKTVSCKTYNLLAEFIPKPLAYIVSKVLGPNRQISTATPLIKHGKIIGTFGAASPRLADAFLPSIENLSRHITNALEFSYEAKVRKLAEKALRESEGRYRAVAESATAGIGIVDTEETITFVNPAFAEMLGYTQEELMTMNLSQLTDKDEFRRYQDFTLERKKGGITTYETCIYHKNGTPISLLVSASPLFGENNVFNGTLAVVIDITKRKKAEEEIRLLNATLEERVMERTEQLRQSEERLHQLEKMEAIGQLAGGIAHDFNNQLSGIMGCADILRTSLVQDPSNYELADIIVKTAKRSSDLTRQLLDFARKGMYQSMPVNIHTIIGEVVSILEHSIDKRITIQQHFNAQRAVINGDPTQLQNIVLNLALNARDSMPSGGELCIMTENAALDKNFCRQVPFEIPPGEYIKISVKDTGIGMDAEMQKRIFEPFFTTKEKGKGLGMGLAAVYGAVKSHTGAITVQSKVGHGTDFMIFLPVASIEEEALIKESLPKHIKGSVKILLIDDEVIVCNAISKMIRTLGHTVLTCNSGQEAIELFKKNRKDIDIVILDLIMPQISGYDIYTHLCKINPRVKVLLASGYSINGEAQKILKQGAAGFIQKPFSIAEIEHKIEELL